MKILNFASFASFVTYVNANPEVDELQKDIIRDPDQLPDVGMPNFIDLNDEAEEDFLKGTMVKQKFNNIQEMQDIKPVSKVPGRVVGGPFTMKEAVRAAGTQLVGRIFKWDGLLESEEDFSAPSDSLSSLESSALTSSAEELSSEGLDELGRTDDSCNFVANFDFLLMCYSFIAHVN